MKHGLYLCLFIFLSLFQNGHLLEETEYGSDYIVLTLAEKAALNEFRSIMRPYLYADYMQKDIYLIRWLRAQNLDVYEAQQMLLNNLKWRKMNNMDTILNEDWSDMKEDYPLDNDTYDKRGRPIATVNLGSWNVLRAVLTGKMPRLTRYLAKLLESSAQNVIESQMQGRNITQFKVLISLDGFNGIQHTCPPCLPFYSSFINSIQNYYTGYAHRVILINTPIIFKTVLDLIQPLFTERTKKILKIFGTNQPQWMEYLDKSISRDQRRPEFGGTKADR